VRPIRFSSGCAGRGAGAARPRPPPSGRAPAGPAPRQRARRRGAARAAASARRTGDDGGAAAPASHRGRRQRRERARDVRPGGCGGAGAAAVGVIGRPQTPQNRAPSSISLEQCGQVAIGEPTSRKRDFARRVVLTLHNEYPPRRCRDQGEQKQRQQRSPAARPFPACDCLSVARARRPPPWSEWSSAVSMSRGSRSSTVSRARLAESTPPIVSGNRVAARVVADEGDHVLGRGRPQTFPVEPGQHHRDVVGPVPVQRLLDQRLARPSAGSAH
jgi:hypothetical protein